MTVRIKKPEFNLERKVSELDYARIPYEKLPAGTVVQTKFLSTPTSGGGEDETASTSFVDAPKYQLEFSPMFDNSIIHVEWWFQVKTNNAETTAFYIQMVRVNGDGQEVSLSGTQSSATANSYYLDQISGSNAIRYMGVNLSEIDRPGTTQKLIYKVKFRSTGGTTIRIGENSQTGKLCCKIQEIRQ